MSRDDFEVIELLGRGGFSEVKLVKHIESGSLYAMKAVEKAELHERRNVGDLAAVQRAQAERDIGILAKQWKCPFIVDLAATFQTQEKLYFVFEYCPGGELFALVRAQPEQRFPEEAARFYAGQICLALEFIHAVDAVHRDVRLENVLLTEDGHAKLADFGCVKMHLPETGEVRTSHVFEFAGGKTQVFYPPEFCQGDAFGKDLDCWQLGIAFFLMLSGDLPKGSPTASFIAAGIAGEDPWPGALPAGASERAVDFCKQLLEPERRGRLGFPTGASQVRGHDIFSADPGFWHSVSPEASSPRLKVQRAPRSAADHRWAKPTVRDWADALIFRLPGFGYTSNSLLSLRGGVTKARSYMSQHLSRRPSVGSVDSDS